VGLNEIWLVIVADDINSYSGFDIAHASLPQIKHSRFDKLICSKNLTVKFISYTTTLKLVFMVDAKRRKKLAFLLRQLSAGLITNDDFEEAVMDDVSDGWLPEQYYRSKLAQSDDDDPIIKPMLELCWGLYDDTRQHKLTKGDELTTEAKKIIARCILFLRSEREYEWPYFDTNNPLLKFSLSDLILSILTLGHHYRNKRERHIISYYEWQKLGDYEFWPFIRKSDYRLQLNNPPFLRGTQAIVV
jgi:hypothetical protein